MLIMQETLFFQILVIEIKECVLNANAYQALVITVAR